MSAGEPLPDTSNLFEIVKDPSFGEAIIMRNLAPRVGHFLFSPDEALNLAAWLVAMADPDGKRFSSMLEQIVKGGK